MKKFAAVVLVVAFAAIVGGCVCCPMKKKCAPAAAVPAAAAPAAAAPASK